MTTEELIKKLEYEFERLYFIFKKHDDGDSKIIGLSKSISEIKISFSYDENDKIIYGVNLLSLSLYEIRKFIEVMNNVIS